MDRLPQALCATLRHSRLPIDRELLQSLTDAEWTQLAQLAVTQRVAALVLASGGDIPSAAQALLTARARKSAVAGLRQQAAFRELAAAVAPQGIAIAALKGMHLATTVYANCALREMSDIDVLVRQEDLQTVADAARQLGFRPKYRPGFEADQHHLPVLIRPGATLEIHWRLAAPDQRLAADAAELWLRARPLGLGPNTFALSPEDALLHICAHATTLHNCELGLRPLCDIRALLDVSASSMHWDVVAARARAWRCERAVALSLALAHRLLGADVPPAALACLAGSHPPEEIVTAASSHLFQRNAAGRTIPEPLGRLLELPRWRDRVRLVWSRIRRTSSHREMLRSDDAAVAGPSRLSSGLRPLRLVQQYTWPLLRLMVQPRSDERRYVDRRNTLGAWVNQD